MTRDRTLLRCGGLSLCLLVAAAVASAQAAATAPAAPQKTAPKKAAPATEHAPAPPMEERALGVLKAMGARIAGARSLSFTAVATYERTSAFGHVLQYSTQFEVTLQRPDKLKVITVGDGPRSEFYYDGKTISQLAPAENLIAVAEAPPTIDAMLSAAFEEADIYFPFTDFLVADPYADIANGMQLAFYIGPSVVVDGTRTDMVAFETNGVFVQAWIGAEDRLPRRARAQFDADPWQLRHQVDISNWRLDPPVAASAFVSAQAASAHRIEFHPKATPANLPAGAKPASATVKPRESKAKPQ